MKYLFYTGRIIVRQKRFDRLIELAKVLSKVEYGISFFIFGEGEEKLIEQLQSLQNGNLKVFFFGYCVNWLDKIPTESIQVFTSDYEGCPLSLLEAYKKGFTKIMAINSPGINKYLSSNCLFDEVKDMLIPLSNNLDLNNKMDLSTYFDYQRFNDEVNIVFSDLMT